MQVPESKAGSPDVAIGIDVGGTFIDVVVVDRSGGVRADKVLTTPSDLSVGIMQGLDNVMYGALADAVAASRIVHATTTATNALLQHRTPKVGLIVNRGFRDVLEIRRHARPDVYNHNLETVPRLYPTIRPGARYYASLRLLESVKRHDPTIFTKSGIMVGLGEERWVEGTEPGLAEAVHADPHRPRPPREEDADVGDRRAGWQGPQAAQQAGAFIGTAHDLRDGFIHFSTASPAK